MRHHVSLVLAAICVLTLCVGIVARADDPPTKGLSSCQSAQAEVLQLRQANAELRRSLISAQVTVEQLRGPTEQRSIDEAWKALEREAGCTLDRQTRECKPADSKKDTPK
jgi:TolA-binding protein